VGSKEQKDDEDFMLEAVAEAHKAFSVGEVPVGAVIVRDGKILSRAHNQRESTSDPLGHAELRALQIASQNTGDWRFEGCSIYVTLEPCPMCTGALLETRMKRLIYGAADQRFGAAGSVINLADYPGLPRRLEVKAGVLEDQCRELLARFFRRERKKKNIRRDG